MREMDQNFTNTRYLISKQASSTLNQSVCREYKGWEHNQEAFSALYEDLMRLIGPQINLTDAVGNPKRSVSCEGSIRSVVRFSG